MKHFNKKVDTRGQPRDLRDMQNVRAELLNPNLKERGVRGVCGPSYGRFTFGRRHLTKPGGGPEAWRRFALHEAGGVVMGLLWLFRAL